MKNWKNHLLLCLMILLSACAPTAAPVHTLPPTPSVSTAAPAAVSTSSPTMAAHPTTPPPAATSVATLNAALPTSSAAQAGKPAEVVMDNFKFNPSTLRVKAGTTVTWTNMDPDDHIVGALDGKWSSKILGKGQTFSFTFTEAGSFAYTCALHPGMDGKVEVEP
jgi:plastocyanin